MGWSNEDPIYSEKTSTAEGISEDNPGEKNRHREIGDSKGEQKKPGTDPQRPEARE